MTLATRRPRPTKPGSAAASLVQGARRVVVPENIVSSGLPAVLATCARIGLGLDDWQVDTSRCILAKTKDGLYAADTAVLSIPRQVGKTYLIGALVFADCIINPGTTTIWTAHRFKVSRETFDALRAIAKSPQLTPHIDYEAITTGAGNEVIPFRNGSRIVFAARERGAIRGFSKVRRLILDEAQILTESAMSDLVPTMNQAENPQIIMMGTPPRPQDPGEVFTNLRTEALSGEAEGTVYVEFAAEPDCDIDDRSSWAAANPSYPARTPARAILRMRKLLSDDDSFRREGLGIWDRAGGRRVIPAQAWDEAGDEHSVASDSQALGIEVAPDAAWASVALAGRRPDGKWHVELDARRDGVAWVVSYVAALLEANPDIRAVAADAGSPTSALFDEFAAAKIRLSQPRVRELGQACTSLLSGVVAKTVHHIKQPQLSAAVSVAGKRPLGDTGMWVWSRASSTSDITPLQAVTLALWGAQSESVIKPQRAKSGGGKVVVFS